MCVYCEIPSDRKEKFYAEHPELNKNGEIIRLQINIVGDVGCGKTSLIDAYEAEQFPSICAVSHYSRYKLTKVNNKPAEIILYDTIGLEQYNDPQTRSLMFMFSEVNMLCYAVNFRESFTSISNRWLSEVEACSTKLKKPFVIVGLRKDLRFQGADGTNSECVTLSEGKALSKMSGAAEFVECSSQTGEGVNEVFEMVIRKALNENDKAENGRNYWRHLFCCFH